MKKTISLILSLALLLGVVFAAGISAAASDSALLTDTSDFSLSSIELTEKMLIGYNIGNAFEMTELRTNYVRPSGLSGAQLVKYHETMAGNVEITEDFIKYLKSIGIQAIRLPVTWFNKMELNGKLVSKDTFYKDLATRRNFWYNGTINADFMARVKQVVTWIIENDMYCILNSHHDGACNNANAVNPVRFGSTVISGETYNEQAKKYLANIWTQIGNEFKDFGSKLIFEPFNEVADESGSMSPSENRSKLAADVLKSYIPLIRSLGGNNAQRFIVCPSYGGVSLWNQTYDCFTEFVESDTAEDKLILTTHTYEGSGSIRSRISDAKNKMTKTGMGVVIDEIGTLSASTYSEEGQAVARNIRAASDEHKLSCFYWDNGAGDFSITNRMYNLPSSKALAEYVGKDLSAQKTVYTQEEALALTKGTQPNWVKLYTENGEGTWAGKYLLITTQGKINTLDNSTGSKNQGYYKFNCDSEGYLTYFTSDDGVNYTLMHTIITTNWAKIAWDMFKVYGSDYFTKQVDGSYSISRIGDGLQSYSKTGDNLITADNTWLSGHYSNSNGNYESYSNRICLENKIDVKPGEYYLFSLGAGVSSRYQLIIRSYDENGSFVKSLGTVTNGALQIPDTAYKISVSLYDAQGQSEATLRSMLEDGSFVPSIYHYVEKHAVNRIIAFGDSVVFGDSNDGYGAGNRFGEEHFLNLLGKEYSLERITKAAQGTADSRWFINLAKNGYTIGDKNYWETTRAAGTYNGTIYEDEVMNCDPELIKNADTVILDGGVNDFGRLAGWMSSATYYTETDEGGNTVTTPMVKSSTTSRYTAAPGESKTVSNMTVAEVEAYVEKYKNLKGDSFAEYKETYKDVVGTAVRSWDEFRSIETEYLEKIVTYLMDNGFKGNIYFMGNPNPFVGKSEKLSCLWDGMLSYCQSEPMQAVADKFDNVYHINLLNTLRDAPQNQSHSTDYLHLSFIGNREVYKVISKAIDSDANTLIFEDNTLPENGSWKTLYNFESYDIGTTSFKYITGGTVKNITDMNATPTNAAADSTKVLYKAANESKIVISKDALPKNTYGIRIKAFTEGSSSFVNTKVFCGTRDLSKSARTNVGRWGDFSYLPGYMSANCATSSVSKLGTLINISDMQSITSIEISSNLNTSSEPCYIDDIEVYTTDEVTVDNESGEQPTVETTTASGGENPTQAPTTQVPATTGSGTDPVTPSGANLISGGNWAIGQLHRLTGAADSGSTNGKKRAYYTKLIDVTPGETYTFVLDTRQALKYKLVVRTYSASGTFIGDLAGAHDSVGYADDLSPNYIPSKNVVIPENIGKLGFTVYYSKDSGESYNGQTIIDNINNGTIDVGIYKVGADVPATTVTPTTTAALTTAAPTTAAPTTVITPVVYGDANGDGIINLLDLIAMRKHLAKWSVSVDKQATDCNADGAINLLDLILMRKYLAKWNVKLGPQK